MKNVIEMFEKVGYIPTYEIKDAETKEWASNEISKMKPEIAMLICEDYALVNEIASENKETSFGAVNVACPKCVENAKKAGADFVVSAAFDKDIAKAAKELEIAYLPICQTLKEIADANKNGIATVGFYPSLAGSKKSLDIIARHFKNIKLVVFGENDKTEIGDIISKLFVSAVSLYRNIEDTKSAEDFYKDAELAVTGYETFHVGINTESSEAAFALATELNSLLDLPIIKGPTGNFFVGSDIEIMKSFYRGANGHIAIRTNSVPCAMYRFEKRGFKFDMSTAYYINGGIYTIYLDEAKEFGGFAVHLLQKK